MQTLISSKPSRMSSLVSARPWMPLGAHGLAHQHGVEPAAASRPAGHDAEFLAALAQHAADLVLLLGGKRSLADARRIGLANAEHISDRAGPEPRSGRRLRRHRIRGGDEWIGAVVDVEQRALRALEQDALALAALLVEQRPHRIHIGQHERRHAQEFLAHVRGLDRRKAETLAQRIMMRQQAFDLAIERRTVGEIHQADGAPADLVLVGRADAAARGADTQRRAGGFADGVELAMQRQDQRPYSRRCADCRA